MTKVSSGIITHNTQFHVIIDKDKQDELIQVWYENWRLKIVHEWPYFIGHDNFLSQTNTGISMYILGVEREKIHFLIQQTKTLFSIFVPNYMFLS